MARRRRLNRTRAAAAVTGLLLALGLAAWIGWEFLLSASGSGAPRQVSLPEGGSVGTFAVRLERAGVIRSALAFRLLVKLQQAETRLKPGTYAFRGSEGARRILERTLRGDVLTFSVTIPEGKTLDQVADLIARQGFCSEQAFRAAATRSPADFDIPAPTSRKSLEGYLMPDTYRFPRPTRPERIVRTLVENWRRRIFKPNRKLFEQGDLALDQVMIAASLIEREARVDRDRPLIASVIRNRLERGMRLQIDATVLYALGHHKARVLFRDLEVDHPYNTYRNAGLPPGPICSPGAAAVEAMLKPAHTAFLYYVARPDGSHIFSRSGDEHGAAIQTSRRLRAAREQ